MTKAIVSAAMICMLFVFSVAFYVIQTVNGDGTFNWGTGDNWNVIEVGGSGGDSGGSSTSSSGGDSGGSSTSSSGGNSGGSSTSSSGGDSGGTFNYGTGDNWNVIYPDCDGECNNDHSGGKDGSCDGCHDGDHCDHGGKPNDNSGGSSSDYEMSVKERTCYNSMNIVINEIYPCTETCVQSGIGGIELYNKGSTPVNVSQWYLKNITGYVMATIKNEEIPPYGFLVVGVVGLTRNYQEINLIDTCGNKVCSVLYTGATYNYGSSYARIPDGGNMWKWMNSTLGYSNMQGTS